MYEWVTQTLRQQGYERLGRTARGLIRAYIGKVTGLSRAQVTRLLTCFAEQREVKAKPYRRNRFPARYTRADIELLAEVDEAHETLSGPATQKILYRALHEFGEQRYQRLATISAAHIYNLRKSRTYRQKRMRYEKTRPVQVAIGERRPQSRTGSRVTCGSIPCTRAIRTGSRACITSTRSMRSRNGRWSERWHRSAKRSRCPCWTEQFPFTIRGFHSGDSAQKGPAELLLFAIARVSDAQLARRDCFPVERSTGSLRSGAEALLLETADSSALYTLITG